MGYFSDLIRTVSSLSPDGTGNVDLSGTYQGINVGTLLAVKAYEPGSADNKTTTSTASGGVDVDATNLAVAFTVPPSGKVIVKLQGRCSIAASGNNQFWTLREGSSQVGKTQFVTDTPASLRVTATFYVSGLTPGAAKTYKWGWLVGGSTANLNIDASGSTSGGAYMEVYAAP